MRFDIMKKRGAYRPPLWKLSEIARTLGISKQKLSGALRKSKAAPKPRIREDENYSYPKKTGRVWYEPSEVIKWWRNRTDDGAVAIRGRK